MSITREDMHEFRQTKRVLHEKLNNMNFKLGEEAVVALNPVMAQAIIDSENAEKAIEEAMKEQNKAAEALVKAQEEDRYNTKIPNVDSLKRLHLSEEAFK